VPVCVRCHVSCVMCQVFAPPLTHPVAAMTRAIGTADSSDAGSECSRASRDITESFEDRAAALHVAVILCDNECVCVCV
jgi:hypothetical protein